MPKYSVNSRTSTTECTPYYCFGATRYAVLVLSTLCMSLIASNWLAFNFTVICMVREDDNGTVPIFSSNEQGWLFSGAMIGRVVGTPPISYFITKIGFRHTFLAYCMISSLATLLTPICVHYGGFFSLLAMQLFQGIAVSVGWSGAGVVSSGWSPPDTYGMFLSVLTLNFQFGPVIVMPLAAAICSSEQLGWPALYYLLGTITAIFTAVFYFFYRDSPHEQKNVSKSELAVIERRRISSNSETRQSIPYKAIFTDLIIWAQLCAHVTRNLGYMIPLVYGAIYFNKALGVQLANTGITAAFPFVVCIIVKLLGGALCDRMKCVSEKHRVMIFASIQYLASFCYLLIAVLPKFGIANLTLMECCFAGITASLVLSLIGAAKCTQLVARQFAHVIFAWQYFLTSAIFLVIPVGISWVAPNNTVDEWSSIFCCSAFSTAVGTTVFNLTLRIEPRPWAASTNRAINGDENGGTKENDGIEEDRMLENNNIP